MNNLEINTGNKTALLFGATGLVGGHCLQLLLEHKAYDKIICFTRRPIKSRSKKIKNIIVDFNAIKNYAEEIVGDDLYLCLGTTNSKVESKREFYEVDFNYNYQIALIAKRNGVNQVMLVSALMSNKDSFFFYSRVKGELEDTIVKLNFWSTKIFRPSLLMGEREEPRLGEEIAGILGRAINALSSGKLERYKPIKADIVAEAMVNSAQLLEAGLRHYESHQLEHIARGKYELVNS